LGLYFSTAVIPAYLPYRMKFPFELAINLPEISWAKKKKKK
jgi:hypothetical protein